ncbi:MAG: NifU family protein [Planctomycetota bacterium]
MRQNRHNSRRREVSSIRAIPFEPRDPFTSRGFFQIQLTQGLRTDVSTPAKVTTTPSHSDAADGLLASVRKLIDTDIRPFVQADGGDIELVGINGNKVRVKLLGACETCPSSVFTLRDGVETRLKAKIAPDLVVEEVK